MGCYFLQAAAIKDFGSKLTPVDAKSYGKTMQLVRNLVTMNVTEEIHTELRSRCCCNTDLMSRAHCTAVSLCNHCVHE
jgi:hypothetical protein